MDLIISQNGYSDYKRKVLEDNSEDYHDDNSTIVELMKAAVSL